MGDCRCVWDCSHAWCGCPVHRELACVCGVRPRCCPLHGDCPEHGALTPAPAQDGSGEGT